MNDQFNVQFYRPEVKVYKSISNQLTQYMYVFQIIL